MTDTEVVNSTVVILKVEIDVIVEAGMTSVGVASSVIILVDMRVFIELMKLLVRAVANFLSSAMRVAVLRLGVVVSARGSGELPSTATTE
jgi:hypothetical protein